MTHRVAVIADDDVIIRRSLTVELTRDGFTVIAFADSLSALKYFVFGERADLLIYGRLSQTPDGLCLAAEVRAQRPNLPIIDLAERTSPARGDAARRAPASRWHTVRSLLHTVSSRCGSSRSGDRLSDLADAVAVDQWVGARA